MDAAEAVFRARELLSRVTPLHGDCGKVCGAACCQLDEDGKGGMFLFPGEEVFYDPLPSGFSLAAGCQLAHAALLTCPGACSRGSRPLACRFFPLVPLVTYPDIQGGHARYTLVMDVRARPLCPLAAHGVAGLSPDFVDACREAGRILCAARETRDFLAGLEKHLRAYRTFLY